jgi:hypothetical protein
MHGPLKTRSTTSCSTSLIVFMMLLNDFSRVGSFKSFLYFKTIYQSVTTEQEKIVTLWRGEGGAFFLGKGDFGRTKDVIAIFFQFYPLW